MLSRIERGIGRAAHRDWRRSRVAEVLQAAVGNVREAGPGQGDRVVAASAPEIWWPRSTPPSLEQAVVNLWTMRSSTARRGRRVEVTACREDGDGRDPRQRPGLRHRGQTPAAAVRAILSGRQGPQPRVGRDRPGAGDRQAHLTAHHGSVDVESTVGPAACSRFAFRSRCRVRSKRRNIEPVAAAVAPTNV